MALPLRSLTSNQEFAGTSACTAAEAAWARGARDDATFAGLFSVLVEGLCRFAYRYTGTREGAEDVVHDAFFGLWRRRDAADAPVSVRSYLYGAVRNGALNAARANRHRRIVPLEQVALVPDDRREAFADLARERELDAIVSRAMAGLPSRGRQVFLLSREHGLRHAEIADVLGISVNTVEVHMTRTLRTLRCALDSYLP